MRLFRDLFLIVLLLSGRAALPAADQAENRVDFDRDVRPILSDKCFVCHGPDENTRQSELRLDDPKLARQPAASGAVAVVPGDPAGSELVRRIRSTDPDEVMPPPDSNLALSNAEQERLIDWIEAGAVFDQHWSFQPIVRHPLPPVADQGWSANAIDRFVFARLNSQGLRPSAPAGRYRLIRRLYLDLPGLPPDVAEVDAFVSDDRPDAYVQRVDRVLASPAFGERFGWDWLNAARYADSNGYQGDRERTMWPWRDWVVDAFNRNLPFDRFTIWQLAGDLLEDARQEQILATGFCRNHMINGEGGRIPEENRVDYVMDMTESMSTVWLGLTLTCARCHDHKYDPLTRRDYYAIFDYFNQTPVSGAGGDPQTPPVLALPGLEQERALRRLDVLITPRHAAVAVLESDFAQAVSAATSGAAQQSFAAVENLLSVPLAERNTKQLARLEKHANSVSRPDYASAVSALLDLLRQRERVDKSVPRVMVMRDRAERRPTYMLRTGLYNKPEAQVSPAIPASLRLQDHSFPGNRLELAHWLVSGHNPLTARVTVNRYWQLLFGQGLVRTTEDFGTQGERPSHPHLMDWLSEEFRSGGWDLKRLCRLIVTSSTYCQTSRVDALRLERDPANRLFSRGGRFRLPSWLIRDQALAVSGLLSRRIGGAPVHPYQPDGVWSDATFGKKRYRRDDGEDLYRRSIYTFWRRIVAPTLFFDSASRQTCDVRPSRTNTPLHALTTLNDVTYVEAARVLAQQVLEDHAQEPCRERLANMFRRVLVRPPGNNELEVLVTRFDRLRDHFAEHPGQAAEFIAVGSSPVPAHAETTKLAAMSAIANLLLNLDEAVTKE